MRAGHVGAVTAIEAGDGFRTLPDCGAHAVHRGVAAADDHDILFRRIELAVVEVSHCLAKADPVGGDQEVERLEHALRRVSGRLHLPCGIDAGRDQDRVMPCAQLGEADVPADVGVEHERHAAVREALHATLDDLFLELEIRDAVDQETACAVVAIINGDLVASCAKFVGRREAGRACADDADAFDAFAWGCDRLHPAAIPCRVGNVAFDCADRH